MFRYWRLRHGHNLGRTSFKLLHHPAQVENQAFATSIGPEMISLELEMIDLMHGPKRRNKLVFKINALRVFDLDFFFKQMESPVYIFFYMLHFSMINYFYLNSLNY